MDRVVRRIRRQLERAAGMERFVRLLLGGGVALVAGLWVVALSPAGSVPWGVGAAIVGLGLLGLATGIGSEIDV